MKTKNLILLIVIGIAIGFFVRPFDKTKTIKQEPEVKIITEYKTKELIYKNCANSITLKIDPWRGKIKDYPADDFMNLVEQCVEISYE